MLCDDVIRKLTEAGSPPDEPALAEHLAGCSDCAAWLDRAQRFEKLWDATRPAEPSPHAWDALWSTVSAQLDQPVAVERNGHGLHLAGFPRVGHERQKSAGPALSPARTGRWRSLAAFGMVGLAQAAALLLAIGLSWKVPVTVPDTLPALAEVNVEAGEGQKMLIRSEGSKVDVVDLTALETAQSFPSIIPILPGVYTAVNLTSP